MLGPQKLPEKLQEMAGSIIFCSIVLGKNYVHLKGQCRYFDQGVQR